MSTDITIRNSATLSEKMEWSKAMAPSTLLPKQYQGNPGNLFFAVEYADALGIERINAVTSIHVIEGKPSASADLIAGLVRRAGHKLRITGDDTYALAQIIRADDPDFTYEARWDLAKARQAGLLGKGVWKNYPGSMLRSRAITEVARMGASDALLGVIYTPEELGADVDRQGTPVRPSEPAPQRSGADRMRTALAPVSEPVDVTDAIEIVEAEIVPDEPEIDTPDLRTEAQSRRLFALLKEANLDDREAVLAWLTTLLGRPVDSTKTLTRTEASAAMDALAPEPPAGVA
jgi:hypothetical protein